ncbi:MAG: NADH-quinone oxidoreductase subunit C [Candidatus Cloacimonadota bacterium]|nr:MAG: NADH-quinone oxidoreductase subunit C [Candidatus Cloacimonadota bacterium]
MKVNDLDKLLEKADCDMVKLEDFKYEISPNSIHKIVSLLKENDKIPCDYLDLLSASDYPDEDMIVINYTLSSSIDQNYMVWLKVKLSRKKPEISSLVDLFNGANWLEREIYDLFGVHFFNHPDLRRILTPEDFVGHGLLKDYSRDGFFVKKPVKISGMKV